MLFTHNLISTKFFKKLQSLLVGNITNYIKFKLLNFSAVKQGTYVTHRSMTGKMLRSEHNFPFVIQLIFPCTAKYHEACLIKDLFTYNNFIDSILKYINRKRKRI